ncbi:RecX family transcriptional regulator [Flavobacterium sp. MAH-1]|uniref:Regulatory protein RecX n=1 Tax=Flavobacterium agri TaxID=2743471 RepID=A0A7Y8Y0I5_9FLAO|nr:regulatory protein RecX [Flavobacterium agri]NUY80336.1 RecX family transcriptional regulator [Flavobacterium agri]NYA70361.1 RecX family transcriptional regulator [Flavobacterium agri]
MAENWSPKRKTYTVDEARLKLEGYCAYQERCHDEVLSKLRAMSMIPEAVDLIVTHLITHNFLNEERFAIAFARGKHRIKKWGKIRITNELKLRNISQRNIATALKEITPDEYYATFHDTAEKNWASITGVITQAKRKKFCDYLLRKGFESNLVYDKLKELEKSD